MTASSSRRSRARRLLAVVAGAALAATSYAAVPAAAADRPGAATSGQASTVPVRVIGFNDFHGNLQPPIGSSGRVTLADGNAVDAGGAAYLAAHAKRLQSQVRNSVVVSAGDAIGASPVVSALFNDEPTIEVLNAMGVEAMALGNHELDKGYRELLRIQKGGCHPEDGCEFRNRYRGADFPILGANVTFQRTGLPALLPFTVVREGGVNVGIIGVTLQSLPEVVAADGIRNLRFGEEVAALNRTSAALERLGIRAQVALVHQGDQTTGRGGPNACEVVPGGPASRIVTQATPRIDAFMLGHSHQAYNCTVNDPAGNPRPVVQGLALGRLLSVIDLQVDRRTRDVVRSATVATNEVVTRDIAPDRRVQSIVDRAVELSAPLANRAVGSISADINGPAPRSTEGALGNLIADAQLASTRGNGAQVALMNPGGVRANLTFAGSPAGEGDGVVTYGEAFNVQPFGNILQTLTYTGEQLRAVLEQQFRGADRSADLLLQPSNGLRYTVDRGAPAGQRVSALTIDGAPVDPAASYRVTVNNFLAAGNDGFTALQAGTSTTGGQLDLDAFVDYLGANPGIAPPATDRVTFR